METLSPKLHAVLSPSGADRWMVCHGSVLLTKDLKEQESEYASEGTDYHELAAVCLEENHEAAEFVGHPMLSGKRDVTEENAKFLQEGYIDYVRGYAAEGTLLIEEKCPIGHLTGEDDAFGTSDAVVIRPDSELIIVDLKFGRGVEVDPTDNRQCKIYALGVIEKHQLQESVETVRIVICQPRTGDGKPKEWVISMVDLLAFANDVKLAAKKISMIKNPEGHLVPSEKGCRFCKAKATCPALRDFVEAAVTEGFENLEGKHPGKNRAELLGSAMDKLDLVEIWMKGIQSQVEIELLAGQPVVGKDGHYKLVQGKKGNRKWDDEEVAEVLFKAMRIKEDDMYNKNLISPADAEKLLAKSSPGRWEKVKKLYSQSEGSKHVANAKDKRPAIVLEAPESGFERCDHEDLI